jgi:hypothetical protein
MQGKRNPHTVVATMEAVWRFLKLKLELPPDLAIPLLGIYLKET